MTEEQKAAYVNAQACCAFVKAVGMMAANMQHPTEQPHTKKDFDDLIVEFGIHHNGVVGLFHNA